MGATPLGRVEFGGPDLPPRRLRDLLQSYVDSARAGSRIDWATYYFRDRRLAKALMRASDRGVLVRLVLEPDPRREGTNDPVITMLKGHGLQGGFHLYNPTPFNRGHLHAKIYAFSQPDIAWIGSFNPSGDDPEDPDVIAEIGDQDRGHNLLIGIERPKLTAALRLHVGRLAEWHLLLPKFSRHFNRMIEDDGARLCFLPRLQPCQAEREIKQMEPGDRFRGAISHLKKGKLTRELCKAAQRGVQVELLVHDTERRVPSKLINSMLEFGVRITRVVHPENLPMHSKFLLIERGDDRAAWLGSLNYNPKSLTRNAELLLRTSDPAVIAALNLRFDQIAAMADGERSPQ